MILDKAGVAVVVLALTACGTSRGGDVDAAPIVATTTIWADITSEVGCGADVPALIPSGADPHTFEPSLRTRATVDNASTVISNGLGLEDSLHDILETTEADVIEVANDVDVLRSDPHIWQDPRRVAATLDTITSALSESGIEVCTDAYRTELEALDAEIVEILAAVPESSRVLVTSHDSLAYFADRYGFEIIGTVIPSTNTLAETNANDLATLAEEIETHGVPAIFTEELESTADAVALADRVGVAVVPLTTDALGDDPDTDTYVEMMRTNATAIAAALAP